MRPYLIAWGPLAGLLAAMFDPGLAWATPKTPSEHEVEAALLYNFSRFVEWPTDAFTGPDEPMIIGIVGKDPFGPILEAAVARRKPGGRPMVIRRWRNAGDVGPCHILFVTGVEPIELTRILDDAGNKSILTVSDSPRFTRLGGMIGLTLEHDQVRMTINLEAARMTRLQISSKLLALARVEKENS